MRQIIYQLIDIFPNRMLDGAILGFSTGTTLATYLDQYKGAITFMIFFLVGIAIKVLKARQELRHKEEKHRQELQQDQEKHLRDLQNKKL